MHPRFLLKGLWVREAGTVAAAPASLLPGTQNGGSSLNSLLPLGLASPFLAARWGLATAQRRDGATSSASTSTTERLSPSGVSQLRDLSRPMTTARSPLCSDSATCSASCRHTLTRKNEVSPSRQLSPSLTRAVTATRKLATAWPLGVKRRSGSSVRLPVRVTWVSAMTALLGLVVLPGRCRWWSGWVPASSGVAVGVVSPEGVQVHGLGHGVTEFQDGALPAGRWGLRRWLAGSPVEAEGAGEQEPQVVLDRPGSAVDDRVQQGVDAEDAEFVLGELLRVLGHGCLLCLVPAGRALLLARPGRPGLSGPPRRRSGQGTARRAERALMSAQRPLTAQGSRWQPVQQATGRSARGCRVPARGAVGEAGPYPPATAVGSHPAAGGLLVARTSAAAMPPETGSCRIDGAH